MFLPRKTPDMGLSIPLAMSRFGGLPQDMSLLLKVGYSTIPEGASAFVKVMASLE